MVDCFSAKFRAILGDPGNLRGQRRKSVSEPCCHRPRPFHPHPLCGNGAARVRPGLWPRLRSCDYNLSSAEPDRKSGETRPPRRSIRLLGPLSAPWSPAGRVHCTSECLSLPAQLRGACGGPTSSVFQLGGLRRGAFRWRGPGLWGGHQGIPRNVYVRGLPGCLESVGWCFLVVEVGAGATPRHNRAGYA